MDPIRQPLAHPLVAKRLEIVFDLYEFAEQGMKQNLRRRFPGEADAEIESRLLAWLQKRPRSEYFGERAPAHPEPDVA